MGQKRGTQELKVTSIKELVDVANGDIVEFPPFSENRPFVARIRRPSMLELVKCGKIPNSLLEKANEMFVGGAARAATVRSGNDDSMKQMFSVLEILCEESFIEPSYKDMKEAGVTLTDDQQIFLFGYLQRGVKALESFRGVGGNPSSDSNTQGA